MTSNIVEIFRFNKSTDGGKLALVECDLPPEITGPVEVLKALHAVLEAKGENNYKVERIWNLKLDFRWKPK